MRGVKREACDCEPVVCLDDWNGSAQRLVLGSPDESRSLARPARQGGGSILAGDRANPPSLTVEATSSPENERADRHAWLSAVLVLASMLAIPLSAWVVLLLTKEPSRQPVQVSERVVIVAASGWEAGTPIEDDGAYLTNGSGTLVVREAADGASASDEFQKTLDQWRADRDTRVVIASAAPADVGAQVVAVRAAFAGILPGVDYPVEGELTVVEGGSGAVVVFFAWASEGEFRSVAEDVKAMIRSATYAP